MKFFSILAFTVLSISAFGQSITPSVSYRGKTFKLSWWDEFSGPRVDSTRWDFRRDSKALSTQLARNNTLENGILRQHLRKETANGKSYTAGGLISEDTLRYGYYETLIKTPPKKGWHSGFWLMKQDGTGGTGVANASLEIDILENDSENLNSFTCLHKKYNPIANLGIKTFNTAQLNQRFVKVGCLYESDSIIFFYDEKQVDKRFVGNLITGKMNIWLTSIGYTSPINDAVLPSTFEVDYIRFYELNPPTKPTITLSPVADAYVQNGSSASSNFGNATTLLCQNNASGSQGEALFQFDLSSIKYYVGSAKLRVFARNQTSNTNPVRIRATGLVNTSVWNEPVINWNNKPAESGVWNDEKTITGTTGKYYEWDVTSYVKAQKEGSLRNSIGIELSQMPGYEDIVELNSKENGSNPPQLIIKSIENLPVITSQPKDTTWMKDSLLQYSVALSTVKQAFFQWKKNGVPIPGATSSLLSFPSLQLADSGFYSVSVSYGIGMDTVESKIGKISVKTSNLKPTANLISPLAGSNYGMSQVINLSGNGTDPETGPLKNPDIRWSYRYFRNGSLVNSQSIGTGFNINFTVPITTETGTNTFYRIFLVVRDPQGGRDSVWRDIFPRIRNVVVQTNPAGYQVTVNGTNQTSPFSLNLIEGCTLPLNLPDPQAGYIFQSWSQGGLQSQSYTIPGSNSTPTANLVIGNITIRNTIADAYVLGSSNSNFGTQTVIGSKFNAIAAQVRESFLRFNLSNLPGSLLNAKLRLYGGLSDNTNPSLKVDVRQVSATGAWEENTVAWTNKPTTIATILASNECFGMNKIYYEWDLTSFLQNQISSGQITVSLHLSSPDETASRVDFNSKEAGTFLPELRLALTDGPPIVIQHPINLTVCEEFNASFSSNASALPNATAQWQVSTNSGSTWTNIPGATQASFSFLTSFSDNGKWFRTVWTNYLGSQNSNPAILTVRQKPNVSIAAGGPVSFCPGGNVVLTANVAGYSAGGPLPVFNVIADRTSPSDIISMLPATGSSTPAGEEVFRALDNNTATKYLNFNPYTGGNGNSGMEILLNYGATIITALSVTSANDAPERDPKTYTLSGSNDGVTWTSISSGAIPAFTARFQKQTVSFTNSKAYSRYRVVFPTIIGTGAGMLQLSELELLETTWSIPEITFNWNTGATTSSIQVSNQGNYNVTTTDAYGCTNQVSQAITVNANPSVSISAGGPTTFCTGGNVTLTASSGSSYLWSTGATTQSITASAQATYSVTVTNFNGCSGSASQVVTLLPNPQIFNITGGGTYCSSPGSGVSVSMNNSESGVNYQFWFTAGDSITSLPGTGSGLIVNGIKGSGTVYVKAKNTTTGCQTNMNGAASVMALANQIWYMDYDGDGFGNPGISKDTCLQPIGYVNIAGDCKDSIPSISCYCRPQDMVCTSTNFLGVQINTLNQSGGCETAGGYKFYPTQGSLTTIMQWLHRSSFTPTGSVLAALWNKPGKPFEASNPR